VLLLKIFTELMLFQVLLGLGAGVHTCYGLTVGEICPNKYKFLGVAICVVSSVITTGFGAYLGMTPKPCCIFMC
jgi:hypothetical protein